MEHRGRKPPPNYHHRQDWRTKGPGNLSTHKYPRELILRQYQNLPPPAFKPTSSLDDFFLPEPSPPLLTAIFPFAHPFGDEPNSRKYPMREKKAEQLPEWYDEEPKDSSKPVKIEPTEKIPTEDPPLEIKITEKTKEEEKDLEEKFTKVDLQVEEKLKKVANDEEEEIPDWDEPTKEEFTFEPIRVVKPQQAPVYEVNLLRYHFAIGNPFAQTLIDFGVSYGPNAITFTPGTKPYEKIWFYKDLEATVHGPFSTLEMFAWTIRDCFPPDLEIAIGNSMFFVPMNIFNSVPQMPEAMYYNPPKKQKEPRTLQELEKDQRVQGGKVPTNRQEHKKYNRADESATMQLKNMLGINKKNK